MTDEKTLPPLTLDDVRVVEPDRDSEAVLVPSETWWAACDKVEAGYPAADVAALLLSMDLMDTSLLWAWWRDEVMEADAHNATREADCPDVLLLAALNAKDVRFWRLPAISGASVVVLRDERDRLQAENARLRAALVLVDALLRKATDAGMLDQLAIATHPDEINRVCDEVGAALAEDRR